MQRSSFISAAQVLAGTLLVLWGWGFDDLPAFFRNPARAGFVALMFAGAVAAGFFGLELTPLRKGSMPVGGQSLQLGILFLLSLLLMWFLPFADRRRILTSHHDYWRLIGLILSCIGVAVRLSALRALGKYFSVYVTLQPQHRLVQSGIYRKARHPLYLSLLLAPTGVALVFASLLALPILVLAIAFVFDRIRKEEQLLADHFGLEFEDYRRRTWKLVPFLF